MRGTLHLFAISLALRHATSCRTDLDCSLNGICTAAHGDTAKVCLCDAAWNGTHCEQLVLATGNVAFGCYPTSSAQNLTCNYTSWGAGPPTWDVHKKQWVLFGTQIAGNCGLEHWGSMSTTVKAVAQGDATGLGADGPYTFDSTVIGRESHNGYYVRDPVSGLHLIYHLYPGNRSSGWVSGCTNGTTPRVKLPFSGTPSSRPPVRIHSSTSLDGPWAPVAVKGNIPDPFGGTERGIANPAPFIFPNGTALILYKQASLSSPAENGMTIWAMKAPRFDGPYTVIGELFHPRGSKVFNASRSSHVRQEDPTIWRDKRGNFHNLDHGGGQSHGFSEDGITWHWSGQRAYSPHLKIPYSEDVVRVTDIERLRMWVNPMTGDPELLFYASGGTHQPIEADGISRGFTAVHKIRTEKERERTSTSIGNPGGGEGSGGASDEDQDLDTIDDDLIL